MFKGNKQVIFKLHFNDILYHSKYVSSQDTKNSCMIAKSFKLIIKEG